MGTSTTPRPDLPQGLDLLDLRDILETTMGNAPTGRIWSSPLFSLNLQDDQLRPGLSAPAAESGLLSEASTVWSVVIRRRSDGAGPGVRVSAGVAAGGGCSVAFNLLRISTVAVDARVAAATSARGGPICCAVPEAQPLQLPAEDALRKQPA